MQKIGGNDMTGTQRRVRLLPEVGRRRVFGREGEKVKDVQACAPPDGDGLNQTRALQRGVCAILIDRLHGAGRELQRDIPPQLGDIETFRP